MTTIVIHDNKVYADGQATAGMVVSYNVQKILNVGNAIICGAGRWASVKTFHHWAADMIAAGDAQEAFPHVVIGMPEKMVEDDFTGAVLYPDGTVVLFGGCNSFYEVEQPVFLGSGSDFAAGAIFAGADGIGAIKAAIHLDPYTGGTIQVEEFEPPLPELELTKEDMESMSKEEIILAIFGDDAESSGFEDTSFGTYELDVDEILTTDKIDYLKKVADDFNIKYVHNIGIEKLRDKLVNYFTDNVDNK